MQFGKRPERCQTLPALPAGAADCIRQFQSSIQRTPIGCYKTALDSFRKTAGEPRSGGGSRSENPGDGEPGADSRPAPDGRFRRGGHQTRGVSMNTLSKLPSFAADGRFVQRRVSGQVSLDGSLPSRQNRISNRRFGAPSATLHSAHRIHNNPLRRSLSAIGVTQQAKMPRNVRGPKFGRDGAQAARICNPGAREPTLLLRWKGLLGPEETG